MKHVYLTYSLIRDYKRSNVYVNLKKKIKFPNPSCTVGIWICIGNCKHYILYAVSSIISSIPIR